MRVCQPSEGIELGGRQRGTRRADAQKAGRTGKPVAGASSDEVRGFSFGGPEHGLARFGRALRSPEGGALAQSQRHAPGRADDVFERISGDGAGAVGSLLWDEVGPGSDGEQNKRVKPGFVVRLIDRVGGRTKKEVMGSRSPAGTKS